MRTLVLFCLLLVSYGPYEPDYVDDNCKEYLIEKICVDSHVETKFGYHYGYNIMNGKYEYHFGSYSETICDAYRLDTVEINLNKKYYR
jgi:hypothetical protein